MQTIVELPTYQRRAESLLTTEERQEFITFLATNPKAGVLIQGAGRGRKTT